MVMSMRVCLCNNQLQSSNGLAFRQFVIAATRWCDDKSHRMHIDDRRYSTLDNGRAIDYIGHIRLVKLHMQIFPNERHARAYASMCVYRFNISHLFCLYFPSHTFHCNLLVYFVLQWTTRCKIKLYLIEIS